MLPEIVIADVAELGERLAALFAESGRGAQGARERFSVALPGGSVATGFFPRLARLPLDWARTEFFWADERAVPPDDPESNYGLAQRLWLEPAGIPAARVHRMAAEGRDLDEAAASYSDELLRVLGAPARLDFVLLGVGPDGHVASLFPDQALLSEERRLVVPVVDAPKPPPRRLTLALPLLAAAELVVVVALGQSKAAVLHEALDQPEARLPVALLARRARRVVFLLDPPAARALRRSAAPAPTRAS